MYSPLTVLALKRQTLEVRQAGVEEKFDTTQKEIVDKLDMLAERK